MSSDRAAKIRKDAYVIKAAESRPSRRGTGAKGPVRPPVPAAADKDVARAVLRQHRTQ